MTFSAACYALLPSHLPQFCALTCPALQLVMNSKAAARACPEYAQRVGLHCYGRLLGLRAAFRRAGNTDSLARIRARPQIAAEDRLSIYASTIAFQWLLTGIIAWRGFARTFTPENLGLTLRSPGLTAIVTAGMAIALCTLQYFGIRRIASMPADAISRMREISLRLMPRSLIEALAFSALAVTAAVCEEFIYRGFVYAALQSATDSVFLPIIGSSLLFSLAHLYQGRRGLVSTFILGLVFAISRWATGNLIAATVTHLAVDLLAGYVAPGHFAKQSASAKESEPVETINTGGR